MMTRKHFSLKTLRSWPSHLTDLWPLSSSEWGAAEDEKMITVMMKSNPQCNTLMSRSLKWTSQHFRKKGWTSEVKGHQTTSCSCSASKRSWGSSGELRPQTWDYRICCKPFKLYEFCCDECGNFSDLHCRSCSRRTSRGRSVCLDDHVPYLSSCRDESVWDAVSEIKRVDTWRDEIINFNSFVFLLQFRKFVQIFLLIFVLNKVSCLTMCWCFSFQTERSEWRRYSEVISWFPAVWVSRIPASEMLRWETRSACWSRLEQLQWHLVVVGGHDLCVLTWPLRQPELCLQRCYEPKTYKFFTNEADPQTCKSFTAVPK